MQYRSTNDKILSVQVKPGPSKRLLTRAANQTVNLDYHYNLTVHNIHIFFVFCCWSLASKKMVKTPWQLTYIGGEMNATFGIANTHESLCFFVSFFLPFRGDGNQVGTLLFGFVQHISVGNCFSLKKKK